MFDFSVLRILKELCVITFTMSLIIIIIIIIIISFMQGIYTYIPETNYVPREYSIAAILLLLFMVLISLVSVLNLLYFYISTFRSMCAVPNMAVFCCSLTSCFPGMFIIIIIIISSSSSSSIIIFCFTTYWGVLDQQPYSNPGHNFTYLLHGAESFLSS